MIINGFLNVWYWYNDELMYPDDQEEMVPLALQVELAECFPLLPQNLHLHWWRVMKLKIVLINIHKHF